MNAAGSSASPPSSPWAQRYPAPEALVVVNNTKRSLLAPHCPRINDPKFYDQDPNQFTDHGIWNLAEVDSVFWSEKIQERTFWGTLTFQLAALNRHVTFSSASTCELILSGHQPPVDNLVGRLPQLNSSGSSSAPRPREADNFKVYQRKRVRIDETKWLSFLRKDRWFDWIQYSPNKRSRPEKTWSVDDPTVWDALRPVLELTHRIFKALIDDRHHAGMYKPL